MDRIPKHLQPLLLSIARRRFPDLLDVIQNDSEILKDDQVRIVHILFDESLVTMVDWEPTPGTYHVEKVMDTIADTWPIVKQP